MHIIHDTNRFCDKLYPMQTTSEKRLVLNQRKISGINRHFFPLEYILFRQIN